MPKLDLHCAATEPKEAKLQGGRFEEGITDAIERFTDAVEPFTESISFDKALYKHDIMGSKVHASMLPKQRQMLSSHGKGLMCGIISHSFELEAKTKGLFSGATAVITFAFSQRLLCRRVLIYQLCCEKHRIQLGKARCLFDQNMEGLVTYTIVILSMRILHLLMSIVHLCIG